VDAPSAVGTVLLGINAAGQMVGYFHDSQGNYQSFVDSGGTFTILAAPSAPGGTWAQGINDQGQIVGYYGGFDGQHHGFLYSGGTYTPLDYPSPQTTGTEAFGINNAGDIVGSVSQTLVNAFGKPFVSLTVSLPALRCHRIRCHSHRHPPVLPPI